MRFDSISKVNRQRRRRVVDKVKGELRISTSNSYVMQGQSFDLDQVYPNVS